MFIRLWLLTPIASLAGTFAFIAMLWLLGFWPVRSGEVIHHWLQVQVTLLLAVPLVYLPSFYLVSSKRYGRWSVLSLMALTCVSSLLPAAALNYYINENVFSDATTLLWPSFGAAGVVLAATYAVLSPRLSSAGTGEGWRKGLWITTIALVAAVVPTVAIWLWDSIARGRFG